MRVLYIADGSITKPILRSQGLPHLSELALKGFDVFLLSFEAGRTDDNGSPYEKILKKYGERIHFIPVRVLPVWMARLQLQMLILGPMVTVFEAIRLRVRVIHARSYVPAILGLAAKYVLGVKLIFDMRGLMIDEFISQGKWAERSIFTRLMRWFEKECILNADEIVVVSEQFKRHVLALKYVIESTSGRPVTVVPNCIDRSRFSDTLEDRQHLKKQLCLNDKVTFVYAGSLDSWQLAGEMVSFFLTFLKLCPDAFLLFVTYTEPTGVTQLLKGANIRPSNYMVVQATPEEVPKYLSLGSVGMLFRKNEILNRVACPLKFAEYLASGVPVLLTRGIGDTEQIVRDHNVGLVIDDLTVEGMQAAARRLHRFVNENNTHLHTRCRSVALNLFSLESAVQKYILVYKRLAV